MIKKHYALAWLLVVAAFPPVSAALDQCAEQARSRYEEIFCELKAKGAGSSLPSLDDFRRNDTRVQALLLKRPAAQLGIKLPRQKASPKRSRPAAKPTVRAKPKPRAKAAADQQQAGGKKIAASPAGKPARGRPRAEPSIAGCRLEREVIVCGKARYKLAVNRQNADLAAGALSAQNRLGLQPYRGKPGDRAALVKHLSGSYRRYIEKMLEIGLGSATMSFTKFYYTHETLSQQGEDFVGRFETMYGFLKKDKASMGIKPRYNDQLPQRVQECTELTARLMVCARGEHNWVYVKTPG